MYTELWPKKRVLTFNHNSELIATQSTARENQTNRTLHTFRMLYFFNIVICNFFLCLFAVVPQNSIVSSS